MTNVLVTGSSTVTGINVIQGLLKKKISVVGCDINTINPSSNLVKNFIVSPSKSKKFIEDIENLVNKCHITHVIATNDHDVRQLSVEIGKLKALDVKFNGYTDSILDFLDKEKTAKLFEQHGVLTPQIQRNRLILPCVVRINQMGKVKKFVHIVKTKDDLDRIPKENFDNGIVTQFIEGPEYTIDVLCDDNSHPIVIVPRLRMEVSGGMVQHAKIVYKQSLITKVRELCDKLSLKGMNCIQCIENEGKFYFIEVNPRPGSGIDLSIEAGANMPVMWVNAISDAPMINSNLKMKRIYGAYFYE